MVMLSFKVDKQLQTISNYFLFSLAVADITIGESTSSNRLTTFVSVVLLFIVLLSTPCVLQLEPHLIQKVVMHTPNKTQEAVWAAPFRENLKQS